MKRLLILAVVGAAMVVPSTAFASGVVLKVDRAAHLVAVAQTKSKVELVHTTAASRLHVGQLVTMKTRALRNGTYSASAVRVVGHATTVHFRGYLLKRTATRYVVSAGGAVIAMHRGGRTTASANDSGGPAPGTTVQVTATLGQDDELDEDQVTTVSADHPGGSIEGTLTLGNGTITVVSDDMALVLNVPSGFDLTGYQSGDEVLAVFTQQSDGTLVLSDLSGDETAQQADQNDDDQGEDTGGDGSSGGGSGGGDDGGASASVGVDG